MPGTGAPGGGAGPPAPARDVRHGGRCKTGMAASLHEHEGVGTHRRWYAVESPWQSGFRGCPGKDTALLFRGCTSCAASQQAKLVVAGLTVTKPVKSAEFGSASWALRLVVRLAASDCDFAKMSKKIEVPLKEIPTKKVKVSAMLLLLKGCRTVVRKPTDLKGSPDGGDEDLTGADGQGLGNVLCELGLEAVLLLAGGADLPRFARANLGSGHA